MGDKDALYVLFIVISSKTSTTDSTINTLYHAL